MKGLRQMKLTCAIVKEKLTTLFNRVLEDHPENDESIMLNESLVKKDERLEVIEAHFIYEKSKCSIQYCKNVLTGQINFLFETFQSLEGPEKLLNLK